MSLFTRQCLVVTTCPPPMFLLEEEEWTASSLLRVPGHGTPFPGHRFEVLSAHTFIHDHGFKSLPLSILGEACSE